LRNYEDETAAENCGQRRLAKIIAESGIVEGFASLKADWNSGLLWPRSPSPAYPDTW
jgi:hypothetical protein